LKGIAALELKNDRKEWKIVMEAYEAITDLEGCLGEGMIYTRRDEFFPEIRHRAYQG